MVREGEGEVTIQTLICRANVGNLVRAVGAVDPRIGRVALAIHAAYGYSLDLIKSDRRMPELVEARHVFYWLLYRSTDLSYPVIGKRMKRDHSTVIHGVKRIERMRKDTPTFRARTDKMLELLSTLSC